MKHIDNNKQEKKIFLKIKIFNQKCLYKNRSNKLKHKKHKQIIEESEEIQKVI